MGGFSTVGGSDSVRSRSASSTRKGQLCETDRLHVLQCGVDCRLSCDWLAGDDTIDDKDLMEVSEDDAEDLRDDLVEDLLDDGGSGAD